MKLVQNWKSIAARSHSMWAFYLSAFLLLLPEALFYLLNWDTNPRAWWLLALVALFYGIFGRLKDQGIDRSTIRSPWIVGVVVLSLASVVVAGGWQEENAGVFVLETTEDSEPNQTDIEFMELAVAFIGRWEGLRLEAYQDIVGVWTVCYGETKGVRPGDVYSKDECDKMFAREIQSYREEMRGYFSDKALSDYLPVPREVAFVDLGYNVGTHGAGNSTATKRLNAGKINGACEALTWWNKAGGRVIRGLVNRRSDARELCMRGLA